LRAGDLRAVAFFAVAFFAVAFLAVDLRAVDFFAADFRAVDFFAADLRAVDFFAAFFAPAFFAVDFFAAFLPVFFAFSALASFLALALAVASFFLTEPTAFFALVVAFFAVLLADFTALPAVLETLAPIAFTASAALSAALVRVVATPLPLLMVLPRQVCCGRGARIAECSAIRAPCKHFFDGSELSVIALFEGVEQVGGGVQLAVVLDLLVALDLDHAAVLQLEPVQGVRQVLLLDQHALEGGRVEAERGAALQALLVGVAVDVLEVLVGVVGRDVGGLRDRGVHPLLGGGLDVHVLLRGDVVGGDEVVRQARAGVL